MKGHPYYERFRHILSDPANSKIKRHPDAGKTINGMTVMHNGLLVGEKCYYDVFSDIFKLNRGVHEPLEEYLFAEVCDQLPDSPTMIELGSYWAFYSMCLLQKRSNAKCYMVEADENLMRVGINNFAANGMRGEFVNATIAKMEMTVDGFMSSRQLNHVDILHCDIQGFELEMLEGAKSALSSHKIHHLFISTHSNDLHQACLGELDKYGYHIICSFDLDETFCHDGIIVAASVRAGDLERACAIMPGRSTSALVSDQFMTEKFNELL